MTSKKVFYLMIGLLVVVFGVGVASMALGNTLLQKKAKQLTGLKLDNDVLDEQQNALIKANKDIQTYAYLENIAQTVVPKDKDQAAAVREIIQIAAQNNVAIKTITFPASNLGAPGTASSSNSSSGSTSTTNSAKALSQAVPVKGIKGVYSLAITITSDTNHSASYNQFLSFLSTLENNRRTAQVTAIKIDPVIGDTKNSFVTFSLTINIFVKP